MIPSFFEFKDGLWRFFLVLLWRVPLEAPVAGASGLSQAPSTYVADLGVCILEYASVCSNSPVPNPVFLAPLGETSITDEIFAF